MPNYILSDQGRQFVSEVFRELCDQWTVAPKLTTTYHPQTNMTERVPPASLLPWLFQTEKTSGFVREISLPSSL